MNDEAGPYAGHDRRRRARAPSSATSTTKASSTTSRTTPTASAICSRCKTVRPADPERAVVGRRPQGVRAGPLARRATHARRRARWPHQHRPAALREGVPATGWTTSATGASAASSGGATRSRSGTATTAATCIVPGRRPGRLPEVRQRDLRQDEDVLDTWFSSASRPTPTSAGPTTRKTCATSTRPPTCRWATTSCSSGAPG